MHLVADRTVPLEAIDAAVAGGVDVVHLRDPGASALDLLARGRTLKEVLAGRVALIVNDRLDVALALGADGAQLGGRSLPLSEARRVAPALLLGVSVHSIEAARAADGADWLLLGTIYRTATHPGLSGAGPALVAAAACAVSSPIVAIGGITPENVDAVLAAGAHGVAVISAILGADSPRDAAARLRERLDAAASSP